MSGNGFFPVIKEAIFTRNRIIVQKGSKLASNATANGLA